MARLHLYALRRVSIPHAVVGVHDVHPHSAAEFAAGAGARAYPTLEGVLSDAKPQVVHVCTPAGTHFGPARDALVAGAHVYVEKPFVETREESDELLHLAEERHLLICPGHQLLRNPGFCELMGRARHLQPAVLVDSYFAFRPPRLQLHRASSHALARQLLDVLPHGLYPLVAALERFGPASEELEVAAASATPVEILALLRKGDLCGRLFVSLRARPVASTLTVTGLRGTLTADLVRAIVVGAGNDGTAPLEKIVNPFLEAGQLAWRSAASLVGRLVHGGDYPGLVELLDEFYRAVVGAGPPPVHVDHLRSATAVYDAVASRVCRSVERSGTRIRTPLRDAAGLPVAVVTGAGGFLGGAITRELCLRGFLVRGIGRSEPPTDLPVHEWIRADLGQELPLNALADATVVVHTAAETLGGFASHERNTVAPTRNVLRAMKAAGARRLVYVSSISVLRPPRTPWERQAEDTPLAENPEELGPYTWGKSVAEALVAAAQQRGDIEARIVRPAALIDWDHIEFPGLLGRRLFGGWYLGLGRPALPFAICDFRRAGAAIAWCAKRFNEAPPIVNLIDNGISTRGQLIASFKQRGWHGRIVWLPISLVAGLLVVIRAMVAVGHFRLPQRLAVWSLLRARRYDSLIAARVLEAADSGVPDAVQDSHRHMPAREAEACGHVASEPHRENPFMSGASGTECGAGNERWQ